MKKSLGILFCALALVSRAALPQPDLLAQIHFAGGQKISGAANFSAFTNEFASAEAKALWGQTADKLSVALAGWLQKKSAVNVSGGAAKLRPLFDDLQASEWFLESHVGADGSPEVAVAIRLDAAREKIWRASLAEFFPKAFFKSVGGWLVFDNVSVPKITDALAQKISQPNTNWLTLDLNWPRLAQWFPKLKELGLPETQFAVAAAETNLLVTGKFFFPQTLSVVLEPWRMPTNSIRLPFVSFTAARGFARWLETRGWAQPLRLSPAANQVLFWAQPDFPFLTFAAVPVKNSAAALQQLGNEIEPAVQRANVRNEFMMPLSVARTNDEISFRGEPFVAPYVRPLEEPAGSFLLAGIFPVTGKPKPLPAELFTRLNQKNLVYYHWEITALRMAPLLNLTQLGLMLTSRHQLEADSKSFKWIMKTGPALGNNMTEIFQSAPDQMTFFRKSSGGFTALELFALANWLEAKDFPGGNLKLPPRQNKVRSQRPQNSAPMPSSR